MTVLFCHCFVQFRWAAWRGVAVGNVVRRINELTLVIFGDGLPFSGGYTITVCNQPTTSTQPFIPSRSLKSRPTTFCVVKAGISHLPSGVAV